MLNSTFNPGSAEGYDKSKLQVAWKSAAGTVTAGSFANIDYTLVDDMLIDGLMLIAKGSNFGDTVTMQIVCITGTLANGVTICPPNTVLDEFGTNIGVCDDVQTKINLEARFPAKLQAGLTVRCIYNSTGSSNVNVIANYKLLQVLI